MDFEPVFRAVGVGARPAKEGPVPRRVVEMDEVRDLVRRQIVENERRGQNETPGKAEPAGRRT